MQPGSAAKNLRTALAVPQILPTRFVWHAHWGLCHLVADREITKRQMSWKCLWKSVTKATFYHLNGPSPTDCCSCVSLWGNLTKCWQNPWQCISAFCLPPSPCFHLCLSLAVPWAGNATSRAHRKITVSWLILEKTLWKTVDINKNRYCEKPWY